MSRVSLCSCRDLCGGWGIAFLAHFLFLLRRYNVSRHDWRWGGLPIWIVVQWPTFKLGEVDCPCNLHANHRLGSAMLACFCHQVYKPCRHNHDFACKLFQKRIQQLTFFVPQVLGSILSRTMLLSIEVAVEYWLSLTWSPQAQWLSDSTHDSPLRDEVSLQLHAEYSNNNSHRW